MRQSNLSVVVASALVGAIVAGALLIAADFPGRGGSDTPSASAAALIPISSEPLLQTNAASVLPAVPDLVNFQGVLTGIGGVPVPDGLQSVTFRVYDDLDNLEWSETQNVLTTGGLFHVLLGSVTPITPAVFDGTPRYLEAQVDGDEPLLPRQQFVSIPYAFHAATADSANTAKTAEKAALANDLDCDGCVDPSDIAGGTGVQFGFASQDALTQTSSTSFVDLSGMSVTINVNTDSVYLLTGAITADPPDPGSPALFLQTQLDGGNIGPQYELRSDDDTADTPVAIVAAGTISSGTHTWNIRWRSQKSSPIDATGRSLAVLIFPQ